MIRFTAIRRVVSAQLGRPAAAPILAGQRLRYAQLFAARTRHAHPALRRHLEDNVLPILALYQVLRESGREEAAALRIVQAVLEASVRSRRRAMVLAARLGLFFPAVRLLIRRVMRAGYPDAGWEIEWVETAARRVAFNVHRCFYADTLARYAAPELTASFCAVDDFLYRDLSSGMQWARTTTIGREGVVCDFCFRRITR